MNAKHREAVEKLRDSYKKELRHLFNLNPHPSDVKEKLEKTIQALSYALEAIDLKEKECNMEKREKDFIVEKMEELYGGTREYPHCTEENEDAILEIWNTAVEKCIDIILKEKVEECEGEIEKTCETCEHKGDSSNEHCGCCSKGSMTTSNWKEASHIKDMRYLKVVQENEKMKEALEKFKDGKLLSGKLFESLLNDSASLKDLEARLDVGKIEDIIQLRYFKLMHPDITEKDAKIVADVLAQAIVDYIKGKK